MSEADKEATCQENAPSSEAYNIYLKTRDEYYALEISEQNKLDSYAYSFSIALVAATFTYFLKVSENVKLFYIGCLYTTWLLSFLSLAAIYFSSFWSVKNVKEGQGKLEEYYQKNGNTFDFHYERYTKIARFCNCAALIFLLVALICAVSFVYANPIGTVVDNCPCQIEVKNERRIKI